MPAFPRTSPCLAPRSHKSSHQPFLYLLFIPLFLPLLIQPSRCPGGLMRSYSNHNSCAHRHRHTHGRCKSRLSNPFPAKSSSLPPGPPPPHSGSADTCYDRGWKPRDYLPESFPYEHVQIMPLSLLGCWGRLFVFGGEEAAGGEKAFPRKQVQAEAPQPHGRPQRRPRRTAGISPLTLQPGGD